MHKILERKWSTQAVATVENIQKRYWEEAGLSKEIFYKRLLAGLRYEIQAFPGLGNKISKELWSLLMGKIESYKDVKLPTYYENPFRFEMLIKLAHLIELACEELGYSLPSPPLLATIFSNDVNSHCLQLPQTNERIILVCEGTFLFYFQLWKIVTLALPVPEDKSNGLLIPLDADNIEESFRKLPEIKEYFWGTMTSFLIHDDMHTSPRVSLGKDKINPIVLLGYNIMCIFPLAHEYAHIIKDHNFGTNTSMGADDFSRRYQEETEADLVAANITMRSLFNIGFAQESTFALIVLYLGLMSVAEKCYSLIKYGSLEGHGISLTHPPFDWRLGSCLSVFYKSLGDDMEMQKTVDLQVECMATICDNLLQGIAMQCAHLCLDGKKPKKSFHDLGGEEHELTTMDIISMPRPDHGYDGCGHLQLSFIGPSLKDLLRYIEGDEKIFGVLAGRERCPVCKRIVSGLLLCLPKITVNNYSLLLKAFANRLASRAEEHFSGLSVIPVEPEDCEYLLSPLNMGFTHDEVRRGEREVIAIKKYAEN